MKAILEVKFKKSDMIDQKSLDLFYAGDMLACMQYLFEQEGIGIFEEKIKLVEIKKK